MPNTKNEILAEFRDKFVKGHPPIANSHFDVQDAESWVEADQEELEEWLASKLQEVEKDAYEKVKELLIENHRKTHALLREECRGWDCPQFQYVSMSNKSIDELAQLKGEQ